MPERTDAAGAALGHDEAPPKIEEVLHVYRRRARWYDVTSHLYWLIGYRVDRYRREGVEALRLAPGDTVVEIGCGTGHNLPLLERAVGSTGRIIGVDLTDSMLQQARRRVERAGWRNVELIQTDAARFEFPARVDAVYSSFALALVPEFDEVIRRAAAALAPGKRMVIVDLKAPGGWPPWLLRAAVRLVRPFAVTLGLAERRPWESLHRHFSDVTVERRYLGTTYIAMGETQRPAEH
jgi:ubiquinone/menaquinone biosynthesis C-methylase UbiE